MPIQCGVKNVKTKRIDEYICLDVDQIIVDEMNYIIDGDYGKLCKVDREYWDKVIAAAKIIRSAYSV